VHAAARVHAAAAPAVAMTHNARRSTDMVWW
jgi:hypothetical protein